MPRQKVLRKEQQMVRLHYLGLNASTDCLHSGKDEDHCGDGCQINFGKCWKSENDHSCAAPKLSGKMHKIPSIQVWGGGSGGGWGINIPGISFPPIGFPPIGISGISLCNAITRALHLCKNHGGCAKHGCDGPSGSWCEGDCGPSGPPSVDGDGELCDKNMENVSSHRTRTPRQTP